MVDFLFVACLDCGSKHFAVGTACDNLILICANHDCQTGYSFINPVSNKLKYSTIHRSIPTESYSSESGFLPSSDEFSV